MGKAVVDECSLLGLAVADAIEDARYAAHLGGIVGATAMVGAYEACLGLSLDEVEDLSDRSGSRAVRFAAAWVVEVGRALLHLSGRGGAGGVSPFALHKAAELLGMVEPPSDRTWLEEA